jgi:hypothetical protein
MPFRAIRNQLRLIRYYSATKPYNRWSRALDISLAAALALAFPVTWVLDRALVREVAVEKSSGKLFQDPGGPLWAWASFPLMPPPEVRGEATYEGSFRLDVKTEDRGWPFVTSRKPRPIELTVELFDEERPLRNEDLPVESAVRDAIAGSVAELGLADAAAAVRRAPEVAAAAYNRPAAWLANTCIWALLLPIAAWVIVSVLRLASLPGRSIRRARREQRRRGDRCTTCGYDLRASAFSDRCPECGTLVHSRVDGGWHAQGAWLRQAPCACHPNSWAPHDCDRSFRMAPCPTWCSRSSPTAAGG